MKNVVKNILLTTAAAALFVNAAFAGNMTDTVAVPMKVQNFNQWEHVINTIPDFHCVDYFDCATLDQIKNETTLRKIGFVNAFVNTNIAYVIDQKDVWNTAVETATTKTGDCEDFATLKMTLLAKLGVHQNEMKLLVVKNQKSEYHAVLEVNGYILDVATNAILKNTEINYYKVLYSFQDHNSYVHGVRK